MSEFPYKVKAEKEDDHKFGNKYQKHQKKNIYKKKGFYSKEDSSTPKLDSENSLKNNSDKYLLISFEIDSKKQSIMDSKEE